MSEKKKAAGVPGRDKTNKAKINEKNDEKSGQSRLFHKFEPIFDENSRILILGTFPSVKSREQSFLEYPFKTDAGTSSRHERREDRAASAQSDRPLGCDRKL